mmetsp:Transcript_41034/g.61294  ORF Transcript_41034/g.61294 Transcript_41034/m.61294 type:complete len:92 (-) Transcript_41034:128-403(-)
MFDEEGMQSPEEVLADLDADGDGLLTHEEFVKHSFQASEEDKEDLAKMIQFVDTDGDGKISKEEIPALMTEFIHREFEQKSNSDVEEASEA